MIQPLLVPAQLLLMPDLKVPATIGTMKMRLIWVERASIGQRANRNFSANGVATHSPREGIILRTVQAIAGAAKLSEILQVLNLISENKQKGLKNNHLPICSFSRYIAAACLQRSKLITRRSYIGLLLTALSCGRRKNL